MKERPVQYRYNFEKPCLRFEFGWYHEAFVPMETRAFLRSELLWQRSKDIGYERKYTQYYFQNVESNEYFK